VRSPYLFVYGKKINSSGEVKDGQQEIVGLTSDKKGHSPVIGKNALDL